MAGLGCLLVVVILVVFLFDWRTAVISLSAIPLSLVSAALVLHFWGATINTMVLAGLVIAMGEVVDDAIIDVENILRRLRINRTLANILAAQTYQVVLAASARSPATRGGVRQFDRYAGVCAGAVFGRHRRFFFPAAGDRVYPFDPGIVVGGADRNTRAVADAAARRAGRHGAARNRCRAARLKELYVRMLPPLVARPRRAAWR